MPPTQPTNRYAAKLLFQFRVEVGGEPASRNRRICEERIILFTARGDKEALRKAKARGHAGQHHFLNDHGQTVWFEFIGVRDLLHLGAECNADEVWYEIHEMINPMERKEKLIPPDDELLKHTWGLQF